MCCTVIRRVGEHTCEQKNSCVVLLCVAGQVSVLDKSKMDWQDFKATDKEVQEELDAHARSDKQYLDKQVRI